MGPGQYRSTRWQTQNSSPVVMQQPSRIQQPPRNVAPTSKRNPVRTGWARFQPEGGNFTVAIPDVPIYHTYTDLGLTRFDATTGTDKYLVAYQDSDFESSLADKKSMLQSWAANVQIPDYKIVATRQFALGGHPGIEIIYEPIIPGLPSAISRLMIVGNRNYTIIAFAPPDYIQFFLTSFQPHF